VGQNFLVFVHLFELLVGLSALRSLLVHEGVIFPNLPMCEHRQLRNANSNVNRQHLEHLFELGVAIGAFIGLGNHLAGRS
jgi:hypothetical protein